MNEKPTPKWLKTLLWYVIALATCMCAWAGLEYAFYGTAEPRPWDAFACLVCAFVSRLFAEYITKER